MQKLFDIKKTQLEMLFDRGYDIREELQSMFSNQLSNNISEQDAINDLTLSQFIAYVEQQALEHKVSIRSVLSHIYTSRNDPSIKILVQYGKRDKTIVSVKTVESYISNIVRFNLQKAIFIADGSLGSEAKRRLDAFIEQNQFQSEFFLEDELTYNPTKHVDVPLHERLTPQEAQAKFQEMKTDVTKILLIRKQDPIVKYYGWSIGDVIRITRDDIAVSVLVSKSINYRVVIE